MTFKVIANTSYGMKRVVCGGSGPAGLYSEMMARLERAVGAQGLKMGELERRLMVAGGDVTGITDVVEEESLVSCALGPNDRRAFRAKLTSYRTVIVRHFPAMRVVQAVTLIEPATRVGIEATAVIPDRD